VDILGDLLGGLVSAPKEEKAAEIVQPVNEVAVVESTSTQCVCGHPEDAHDGPCVILECDCPGFSASATEVVTEKPNGSAMTFVIPAPEATPEPPLPAPSTDMVPDGFCAHLCDSCNKWWTHGPKKECKYPDIIKQGPCQECNKQETYQVDYDKDFQFKNSTWTLTPEAQIRVRNDENMICRDMSVEQLTNHINYYNLKIQELHSRSLQAMRNRRDLEEEQLKDIPESEREAFLEALRAGGKEKKPRTRKTSASTAKKDPALLTGKAKETALIAQLKAQGVNSERAKIIGGMMAKTGKTREQVEAWLDD
jgi:hypothetical protein